MNAISVQQELLREVAHDHDHFERMFSDLREMFRLVVTQELSLVDQPDLLSTALDDLHFLIEEIISHFENEEEFIFSIISEKYPHFAPIVVDLQKSHDFICSELTKIDHRISCEPEDVQRAAIAIYEALTSVRDQINHHADDESKLFESALDVLANEDCERLRDALRRI